MTEIDTTLIQRGLCLVQERIARACERVGRDPKNVQLVAVSKTYSAAHVRAAYEAGQLLFGENYVQECVGKAQALSELALKWHFIGHLQRNKVKDILPVVDAVQTVDSQRLAETLSKAAEAQKKGQEIMLQVNVAEEPQKSGCTLKDLDALVAFVRAKKNLTLAGLMTVPPMNEDPKKSRPYFRVLREHAQRLGIAGLSMGMSHDLEVAVEEGATLVRVGTAIFGARPPHP